MPMLLFLCQALAGDLVVDAKVPAAIQVDGQQAAELYTAGVLHLALPDGAHRVTVSVAGSPASFDLTIGASPVVLLVGRSGSTIGAADALPPAVLPGGDLSVRFRSAGRERLLLQIDGQRVIVAPGTGVSLPVALGEHPMTVRSPDGTSIYARGVLVVSGAGDLVVQLAEGRLPETSGAGVAFDSVAP